MLEINNLFSGYNGVEVIRDITLRADRGEVLCIVGPNGCGKSTLLKAIARIIPCRGEIRLDGRDAASLPRKSLAKKIALLGQMSQIHFPYSVYDTAALGRYAHSRGFLKSLSKEDRLFITDILRRLELYDEKDRLINELSGGQLQRVFLARTLIQDPDLILLDEPTNHLDLKHQIELLRYLTRWAGEHQKAVVAVLHDLNLALCFGDRAALMRDGRIVSCGPAGQALDGETLREVYGIDIKGFMVESLTRWSSLGNFSSS
ncbi:MAG: ABC transporter ATP-binding protein [Treponema sp.]|jgi:iron complex transport system ATP-binding protein|nr:ABC transporter ATP-binding protein [Treponema sp.]